MRGINEAIITGNLVADFDVKKTHGGRSVLDLTIALNERRKSQKTGEWVEETTYVDVTVWGKKAEYVAAHTGRGSPVIVQGKLAMHGERRNKVKIVADEVIVLSATREPSGA